MHSIASQMQIVFLKKSRLAADLLHKNDVGTEK